MNASECITVRARSVGTGPEFFNQELARAWVIAGSSIVSIAVEAMRVESGA